MMNAFDLGLIMGILAMAYITYTVVRFEVK